VVVVVAGNRQTLKEEDGSLYLKSLWSSSGN